MKNRIRVFVVDDRIPRLAEFVERRVFNGPISQEDLRYLVKHGKWTGEESLKKLLADLVHHEYASDGSLTLSTFTNPEICIRHLSPKHLPHVIIFDWEYDNHTQQSGPWLLEILRRTRSFVFVYSGVRNSIPPTLNKKEFDKYSKRFQLFEKGESEDSVFSSEEFIYQYILSRIDKNNIIHVGGLDVRFEASGYLKTPTDILYLESVLGRAELLEQIKKNQNAITEQSVEKFVNSLRGKLMLNQEKGFLVTPDSELFIKRLAPDDEISYVDALKRFGLTKLTEAIEVGFARVRTPDASSK